MTIEQLRYKIDDKKQTVNFALQKVESQRGFLDKQLDDVKHSIYIYIGFIVVPGLIFLFCLLCMSSPILSLIFSIPMVLSGVFEIVVLPYSVYKLLKYNMIRSTNKKSEESLFVPPAERNPVEVLNRPSVRSMQDSSRCLYWIMGRYVKYQEDLKAFAEEAKGELSEDRIAEISANVDAMKLYVDIQSEDKFTKKKRAICITIVIVAFVALIGFSAYRFIKGLSGAFYIIKGDYDSFM